MIHTQNEQSEKASERKKKQIEFLTRKENENLQQSSENTRKNNI